LIIVSLQCRKLYAIILSLAREILVNDIPAGDRKKDNLFCSVGTYPGPRRRGRVWRVVGWPVGGGSPASQLAATPPGSRTLSPLSPGLTGLSSPLERDKCEFMKVKAKQVKKKLS
jgi:hypothetical protein